MGAVEPVHFFQCVLTARPPRADGIMSEKKGRKGNEEEKELVIVGTLIVMT
jgi:hypothetical protein